MTISFKSDNEQGKILHSWWEHIGQSPGERAELRRCQEPAAIYFLPAYHKLFHQLQPYFEKADERPTQLASIAGLLAQVKILDNSKSFAQQLANNQSGKALVSEIRFRKILERERDELYLPLIRVIRMLNGAANIYDLSNSVFYWGDNTRQRWTYDYFGATSN